MAEILRYAQNDKGELVRLLFSIRVLQAPTTDHYISNQPSGEVLVTVGLYSPLRMFWT